MKISQINKSFIKQSGWYASALLGFSVSFTAPFAAQATTPTAGEITINDCNGVTRAQIALSENSERKNLTVGVEEKPVAPSKLVLKSNSTTATAEVKDLEASFLNLGSGVYQVCPESGSAEFSTVHFHAIDANSESAGTGIALGAAALVGSVVAIGSNGSGSEENASVNVLSQPTGELKAPAGSPAKAPQPARTRPNPNSNCLNGSRVTPLSPFN